MHMMKTRQEIKLQAREALRRNQGQAIGLYLIAMLIVLVAGSATAGAASLLIMPVVWIAVSGFFHRMYRGENVRIEDAARHAFDRYLAKTGGYLWMVLLIALGCMLFVIPGLVLAVGYSMAPYVLHDCPRVRAMEAVRISWKMTRGYKVDLFVAELSFLGWGLLSAFTFGILDVIFVGPYRQLTFGGIYEELKNEALSNGTVTQAELDGEY